MLDHAAIAARIPHSGRMCLLERVIHWDELGVRCSAISHRDADNPLRESDGLPVWAGIEYAAQAAAVHAALVHDHAVPRAGAMASLRNVEAGCEHLDRIEEDLLVEVSLLHGDPAGAIYRFDLHAGEKLLLSGQFTLMFGDLRCDRDSPADAKP